MISKIKIFSHIIFICCFLFSTKVISQSYSYKISFYTKDKLSKKSLLFSKHLISYENYLFEFVYKVTVDKTSKNNKGSITTTSLDTTSVILLDYQKRNFYEFDEFSLKSKLIDSGKFSIKKGIKLSDTLQIRSKILLENHLRDTFLNKVKTKYVKEVQKNVQKKDSVITYSYFIKNVKFISLIDFLSSKVFFNLSAIGIAQYNLIEKSSFHAELEDLRLLNAKEIAFCSSILKIIKDTNN
jgi:hypothetical protein